MVDQGERLRHVLAEQRFPAARWELLVTAELYGADGVTRRELRALPEARFRTLDDVLLAARQTQGDGRPAQRHHQGNTPYSGR